MPTFIPFPGLVGSRKRQQAKSLAQKVADAQANLPKMTIAGYCYFADVPKGIIFSQTGTGPRYQVVTAALEIKSGRNCEKFELRVSQIYPSKRHVFSMIVNKNDRGYWWKTY